MIGTIESKRELPARARRGRRGARPGRCARRAGVALGVIAGVILAGAGPVLAQTETRPARGRAQPALGEAQPAETPAPPPAPELPPLAGDSAAPADAGADAPWSRGVDPARRRAARRAFLDGNELARKRFFATAAAKYKQALQLWPHPAFSYNLGLAQLQLDQPVEAHASLTRALAHGPGPLAGKHEQAEQQLALIETALAPIEVICAEPGAHVMLDGRLLFTAPGRHRGVVRPGAHQLVATRRGWIPVIEQIVVSPGEPARFELAFEHPEAEERPARLGWTSVAAAGAGVALLLAGGGLDWHADRVLDGYEREFVRRCPMGCASGVPRELADRQARAGAEQRAAVIAYAVGGAALATGVVLAFRDRTGDRPGDRASDRAPRPGLAPSAIAPMIAPGAIGMSAGFRF